MKPKRNSLLSLKFIIPNVVLLVVVVALVQTVYHFYVTPRANELLFLRSLELKAHRQDKAKKIESQPLILVIKDHEPSWEITFFLWGTLFLTYRLFIIHREQKMLEHDFVGVNAGERILPDGALQRFSELKAAMTMKPSWRERILPGCVLIGLQRFHATGSVSEASQAIKDRTDRAAQRQALISPAPALPVPPPVRMPTHVLLSAAHAGRTRAAAPFGGCWPGT